MEEVAGSIPARSTKYLNNLRKTSARGRGICVMVDFITRRLVCRELVSSLPRSGGSLEVISNPVLAVTAGSILLPSVNTPKSWQEARSGRWHTRSLPHHRGRSFHRCSPLCQHEWRQRAGMLQRRPFRGDHEPAKRVTCLVPSRRITCGRIRSTMSATQHC